MKVLRWLILLIPIFNSSCSNKDYYSLPLYSDEHRMQAVVEIPAGSSHIIDYSPESNRFNLFSDREEPSKDFLALPFNYGFIPSTINSMNATVTGHPLDVFILSESINTGNVVEILPLGLVTVRNAEKSVNRIIAVPYNKSQRTIDAENFQDLQTKYPGVVSVIEEWILNTIPDRGASSVSWQDEVLASKMIESLALNQ